MGAGRLTLRAIGSPRGKGGSVPEQAGQRGPCEEDNGAGVETESRRASRDHADAELNF